MVGCGGIGTVSIPFLMGITGENFGTNIAMMSPSVLMLLTSTLIWKIYRRPKQL
jgi:nitrate/nitrite transporter NarK